MRRVILRGKAESRQWFGQKELKVLRKRVSWRGS